MNTILNQRSRRWAKIRLLLLASLVTSAGMASGQTNLPLIPTGAIWKYLDTGVEQGLAWIAPGFDDRAWSSGPAQLGYGDGDEATLVGFGPDANNKYITAYFRQRFIVNNRSAFTNVQMRLLYDDGVVVYLNGKEVFRANLPAGAITFGTLALSAVEDHPISPTVNPSLLVNGTNILAAEVHQCTPNSSDLSFDLAMTANVGISVPGQNVPSVVLNEVLANNQSLTNADGTINGWVELVNLTAQPLNLADCSLTDDLANPRRWVFPVDTVLPPSGFIVVHCDGGSPPSTNANLRTGFSFNPGGGGIYLFSGLFNGGALLDSLAFGLQAPDYSLGRVPDATGAWTLCRPTPAASNLAASLGAPNALRINEWMANMSTGGDWFELYNPQEQPVALGECYLTDDLALPTKFHVPVYSYIGHGAHGYAVFYSGTIPVADRMPIPFKLSNSGESIGLFDASGGRIDTVSFGPQETDVSEGRLPDGTTNIVRFPGSATPGTSNHSQVSEPPVITQQPVSQTVIQGDTVAFGVSATGTPPLSYQWQKDGTNLNGQTHTTLTLTNALAADRGRYCVTVANAAGSVISSEATLTVVRTGPGSLDLSFQPGLAGESANHVFAQQPDSKLLVASERLGTGFPANQLVRLHPDGSLDTNFYSAVETYGYIATLQVQPDGRILVGGSFTNVGGLPRTGLARLNADGSVDAIFNAGFAEYTFVRDFALLPDGRLLVAGYLSLLPDFPLTNRVVRLLPDGQRDPTYSTNAIASYQPDWMTRINDIVMLPDGRLIIAGYFSAFGGEPRGDIVRLTEDGQVDTSFEPGIVINGSIYTVALQRDGKILVGGNFSRYGDIPELGTARLQPDGSLDLSFAVAIGFVDDIVLQPDGCILVAGTVPGGIVRLNPDGTKDRTFDPGTGVEGEDAHLTALLLQEDGQIVIGGTDVDTFDGFPFNGIARLNGGGITAPSITVQPVSQTNIVGSTVTFTVNANGTSPLAYQWEKDETNLNGQTNASLTLANVQLTDMGRYRVIVSNAAGSVTSTEATLTVIPVFMHSGAFDPTFRANFNEWATIWIMVQQADGKLVLGGDFTSINGVPWHGVVRLYSDGSLDTNYQPFVENPNVFALAVQADGKVVVGGDFTCVNGAPRRGLARLNPDGTLDAGFAPGLPADAWVGAVAIQADGKVLAAMRGGTISNATENLVRFHADGTPDADFSVQAGASFIPRIHKIVVQPDGAILIGGVFSSINNVARNGIARLRSDGRVDLTFNPGTGADGPVNSIALQPDGKVFLGGFFTSFNGVPQSRIVRLKTDGSVDTSFSAIVDDGVSVIVPCPDGKLLIGGFFSVVGGTTHHGVARLNADGSLDATFDPGSGIDPISDGSVWAIVVQADGKIVIAGDDFLSFDGFPCNSICRLYDEPVVLQQIGILDTSGFAQGVTLSGNYAYVADGDAGLQVVDITNPADPRRVAGYDTSGYALAVLVSGNYAYVADGFGGLQVIDISSPANPQRVGGYRTNGMYAEALAVAGNYMFVVGDEALSLRVIDITDPANPRPAGGCQIGGQADGITVSGHYAFLADGDFGLKIVDISDTVNPHMVGSCATGDDAEAVLLSGHYAYVPDENGLKVIDVNNPANPTLVGACATSGYGLDLAISSHYAYVASPEAGVQAIDISDPANPRLVGGNSTFSAFGVVASGENLFVAAAYDGLIVLRGMSVDHEPPTITQQPVSQTNFVGSTAPFTVTATGTLPLSYLWFVNGTGYLHETNSTLVLRSVQLAQDGSRCWVVISNAFGSVTSTVATLTVIPYQTGPGSLDLTFDPTAGGQFIGLAQEGIFGDVSVVALAVQADGKIVIGGSFSGVDGVPCADLARLTAEGRLDPTFRPAVPTHFSPYGYGELAVQTDGKVLLADNIQVIRLNPDGSLDEAFSAALDSACRGFALQPNGQIVVFGGDLADSNYVDRLNPDGSHDPGFQRHHLTNYVRTIALEADGEILVAWETGFGGGVTRLNPDGTEDPAFSTTASGSVYALAPTAGGKIVIGGAFYEVNGHESLGLARLNGDGTLDNTFNPEMPAAPYRPWIHTIAVQPDGSLIIGGTRPYVYTGGCSYPGYSLLLKLNPDGREDTTFTAQLGDLVGTEFSFVSDLALMPDGRILAGGYRLRSGLFGVLANGAPDPTFDPNLLNFQGSPGTVQALSVQADGTIFVRGQFDSLAGVPRPGLTRVTPEGTLDPSFVPALASGERILAHAVQPDGKVVIGTGSGVYLQGQLLRLNADGNLDSSFNPTLRRDSDLARVMELLAQPDGRILVVGDFTTVNDTPRQVLARLNSDGTLDLSFDAGLEVMVPYYPRALALQPDGKILAGRFFLDVDGGPCRWLVRLNSDGRLDSSFQAPCFDDPYGPFGSASSLLLLPDGRILVGLSRSTFPEVGPALVRLNADGSLDPSFHLGTITAGTDIGYINALVLQPDGKILIGGAFDTYDGVALPNLVRLHPDGHLDPTFVVPWGEMEPWGIGEVDALALQANGQVIVGGWFRSIAGLPCWGLARLNGDGTPVPFVRRQLTGSLVQLDATPGTDVSVYAVEDVPPTNWSVTNISHDGVIDMATGKVKFGPFYDHEPRTLSYQVLTPVWGIYCALGVFCFSGQASADGVNSPITGDSCMALAGLLPADVNPVDSHISIGEVTAYGAAWREGSNWLCHEQGIPIDYVTRTAFLWRAGECYTVDFLITNEPLWWVSCSTNQGTTLAALALATSAAERQMPSMFIPGEALAVSITATPADNALTYAVEDQFPSGWIVTNVNQGGELDTRNGKVKWGPFLDAHPRILTYQVVPPASASGAVLFDGVASFDGAGITVVGPHELLAGSRLRTMLDPLTSRLRLSLVGPISSRYVIETSTDLLHWLPLVEVTSSPGGVALPLEGIPDGTQRFYRAKLLE